MKFIGDASGCVVIELTRRNLRTLLVKLDDPWSARALVDPDGKIIVRAVESSDDRGDAVAQSALAAEGVVELTRDELQMLVDALDGPAPGETAMSVSQGVIVVRAVADAAHYRNRAPGVVWMPTRGEFA